jgi:hypothetical protein
MTTTTQSIVGIEDQVCPVFLPGINFCNVIRPSPRYADFVLTTELDSLLPESQVSIDLQSRPANYKLNGHVQTKLGFTLLPSAHGYDARVGQK